MTRDNHVQDEIEIGIFNAIREAQNNPKHGIVSLVFPTLPQQVVDQLYDQIEDILQYHLDVEVYVDV